MLDPFVQISKTARPAQVYILFFLNAVLQAVLLSEISREQNVLDVLLGLFQGSVGKETRERHSTNVPNADRFFSVKFYRS